MDLDDVKKIMWYADTDTHALPDIYQNVDEKWLCMRRDNKCVSMRHTPSTKKKHFQLFNEKKRVKKYWHYE